MAYAEIITIEYNGYSEEGFTDVAYESRDIDEDLKYIIMYDQDDKDEKRKFRIFNKRLDSGETIRLVSDVGACNTRITVLGFYLITGSNTNDPAMKEWLDNVKERYGDIATDSDQTENSIYNKRWPGTNDLKCPMGFQKAEDISDLDYGNEDEDDE